MPRSTQSERRTLAKLRTELHAGAWAIDARHLGLLSNAIEAGDVDEAAELLAYGREQAADALGFGEGVECTTKIINGIAVIPVSGVLRDQVDYMVRWGGASSYQLIERDFNQAIGNALVKGVLFYCNSPGGSAIGCKRIGDLVFAARGSKPIRAYVQRICGSAMYYIAAACDRIEATADSLVGSIGTIYPHLEMNGFLKEIGYGATVFTNADSPKKGHGNMYEPLSDEAKATLQRFVDSYGRPFIEDVARYRGITPADVVAKYGQGDAMRADVGVKQGIVDAVVDGFAESLDSITKAAGTGPSAKSSNTPVISGAVPEKKNMNARIKAQLFALGLIDSTEASDEICKAALAAWCGSRGEAVPSDETQILASLQKPAAQAPAPKADDKPKDDAPKKEPVNEQEEARLEDLRASAALINEAVGYEAVSAEMVLEAATKKLNPTNATKEWTKVLAEKEPPVRAPRIKGEGADRFVNDAIDALLYRSSEKADMKISDNALQLVNMPLWAVAGKCLENRGIAFDVYGERGLIAQQAMAMGVPGERHTFFSANEGRQYVQAASPANRPGDFPNILSGLANKFLDTIELDDDYSYPEISAVLPGGLSDFKPAMMVNKGIVEELDEVKDAEGFKELGMSEEVLSYLFVRRFGNKFGWTPVMVANDDLAAFVEGMIGLQEAWQVTQNRLVVDRFTSSETLLDGNALFANRTDIGSAANDNKVAGGGSTPSDAQWASMEAKYADISGIGTARRVRGTLNVWFGPTGTPYVEARRTFAPLNVGGLEGKVAESTSNVGLYRGTVKLVPESELRGSSTLKWYGLRNPTRLNTATVVRGYFNGFGTNGRRERWYDPENKTTWVSIEGRIAVAVKNWRYAIENKGEN